MITDDHPNAKEAMEMNTRVKIAIPAVALALAGGAYTTLLSGDDSHAKAKVHGEVYVLPREFLVNLEEGRFAKFTVGLILEHGALAEAGGGGHGGGPKPPEGFGPLPQEALVRDLVTDAVTGADAQDLVSSEGRAELKRELREDIEKNTDVPVEQVLLTDVAVQ